jgi:transposase
MSRSCQNRRRDSARTVTTQNAGSAPLAAPLAAPHAAAVPTEVPVPGAIDPKATRSALAPGDTPAATPVAIGVGIDTSRYGHHATFLRADLQPAAADLQFVESAQGYQHLQERLAAIGKKYGPVHFHFRLDVAGRYADNLLAFLQGLPEPRTISCGDPQRNKNYRAAIFGHKKSDAAESTAAARYALTEKPKPVPVAAPAIHQLCQIASRLESQTRQCTRTINQLHNLLACTFPELALLVKDLSAGWVLTLLDRYPTAAKLGAARASSLEKIPYLPHERIAALLEQARTSIASLTGPVAEELVRDLVGQLKDAHGRHNALEKLLVSAYRQLPEPNHLDSIIGIGEVTAAILTAKMVTTARFVEPGKLVGYFGIYPVEASSGIDRDGQPRAPKRMVMSQRGNDLVRRYLYMAALSAVQHNPAVRPLYQRVRAKHPDKPGLAVGHAMRKLLHLALAVWQTGKPFDPKHYDWDRPAHLQHKADLPSENATQTHAEPTKEKPTKESAQAAGHKNPVTTPVRSVVTAACDTLSVTEAAAPGNHPLAASADRSPDASHPSAAAAAPWIDFAYLKIQLPLQRVLEHLSLLAGLRGRSSQRKGPCPVHAPSGKGRTFSVNLDKNLFQCFDPQCACKGDVIDLWAALHKFSLRDAAVDLIQTFELEPAPRTEKRHG